MCDKVVYGHCHLVIGPMFAGKTSTLIKIFRDSINSKLVVSAYKHLFDDRYDNAMNLCTHDRDTIQCTPIKSTSEIFNDLSYNDTDVIIIDEAHFFDYTIVDDLHRMIKDKKSVVVAGLSSDYKMKPFGYIPDICSMCDSKTELVATCSFCEEDTPASFTARIIGSDNVVEVGSDNYKPVCRAHHYQYSITKNMH